MWDNVVQATVKITLKEYEIPIERTFQLILSSGQRYDARVQGEYLENGQTFWPVIPQDNCQFICYDVLYKDTANKLSPKNNHNMLTVYIVTT